ncbi:hypothetical protein L486_05853 [Kwoniella mangroviensis CBS 10435]|uniref:Uncharacterized protein n=1 Tax=Kwoniella mangroviensis CBS 10435 TaxID=1331196 RepID=A0A1B9IN21_9TREE|nr:uncharacterized protein I203_03127 [Kwoniella mangroviensis CBS 8507]OCF56996.1 hypothetical protein L486_05853 [Kwoniella mangroviensis CBS 10435]OCF67432.1 hypothetical protein I203_03127 [Kwoniella mangroviensis CBS 8507]OCF75566.1 hypothetical protein I204_04423 [Kwoniella mangroviensis CBS 8886]
MSSSDEAPRESDSWDPTNATQLESIKSSLATRGFQDDQARVDRLKVNFPTGQGITFGAARSFALSAAEGSNITPSQGTSSTATQT